MFTKLGIYSILAGFFVGVFGGISQFMQSENFWVDLTISKFTKDNSDAIIEFIPVEVIQEALSYMIYDLPFAGALVGLGIIFIGLGAISKEH
jgi:hypothetical protein